MKKTIITLAVLLPAIIFSCKKNADKPNPASTVYLDLPAQPADYKIPSSTDSSRKKNNQLATLGRVLFYDTHLSLNNSISCASCHKQVYGFADNEQFSKGYEGRLTGRNSPGISNLTGSSLNLSNIKVASFPLFWDGRENTLTHLIGRPVTNHVEMGVDNFDDLPAKLSKLEYYPSLFGKAFGDNTITTDRISTAVATFLACIQSDSTRFNTFLNNLMAMQDAGTAASGVLTSQELNGYILFTSKYNCTNCHRIFTNSYSFEDLKDIGLDEVYKDKGLGALTGNAQDNGKFKAPRLHNVAITAPYMHDGRYKTLEEVIDHYSENINNSPNLDTLLKDKAGKPMKMHISANDKQALIAFLGTMTDHSMITDQKFSNPFKTK